MTGDDDDIVKWEVVCETPLTERLDVLSGWLYKVNDNIVFVPFEHHMISIACITDAVEALKDLFEEATFNIHYDQGEVRVIRISDIRG